MAAPRDDVEFDEDDVSAIVDCMGRMARAGAGWINLVPEADPDADVRPGGGMFSLFSARGPAIPLGTWSAGGSGRRGPGRPSVGLQHGSGPKALARLEEHGLGLPSGWLKVQDHPRRGLVATVPVDADPDDVLFWLLAAMHALCEVPLTGRWLARVYAGTT